MAWLRSLLLVFELFWIYLAFMLAYPLSFLYELVYADFNDLAPPEDVHDPDEEDVEYNEVDTSFDAQP